MTGSQFGSSSRYNVVTERLHVPKAVGLYMSSSFGSSWAIPRDRSRSRSRSAGGGPAGQQICALSRQVCVACGKAEFKVHIYESDDGSDYRVLFCSAPECQRPITKPDGMNKKWR